MSMKSGDGAWRKKIADAAISETPGDFDAVMLDWFRAKFKEVKARGCRFYKVGWKDDENAPFFILALAIAEAVEKQFEFQPFEVKVYGSRDMSAFSDPPCVCGAQVEHGSSSFTLSMVNDTSRVILSYQWPHHGIAAIGMDEKMHSSHAYQQFDFDLADPDSTRKIMAYALGLAECMTYDGEPDMEVIAKYENANL